MNETTAFGGATESECEAQLDGVLMDVKFIFADMDERQKRIERLQSEADSLLAQLSARAACSKEF